MDTWAEREIEVLRILFRGDTTYMVPTENQQTSLNSLLGKGLRNHKREVRIRVLQVITGITNLQSSAQLTMQVVSCLIDYFKNRKPCEGGEWNLDGKVKRLLAEVELGIILELIDRSWNDPSSAEREKNGRMVDRGQLSLVGYLPRCPICSEAVLMPDMHEALITRGDFQRLPEG